MGDRETEFRKELKTGSSNLDKKGDHVGLTEDSSRRKPVLFDPELYPESEGDGAIRTYFIKVQEVDEKPRTPDPDFDFLYGIDRSYIIERDL